MGGNGGCDVGSGCEDSDVFFEILFEKFVNFGFCCCSSDRDLDLDLDLVLDLVRDLDLVLDLDLSLGLPLRLLFLKSNLVHFFLPFSLLSSSSEFPKLSSNSVVKLAWTVMSCGWRPSGVIRDAKRFSKADWMLAAMVSSCDAGWVCGWTCSSWIGGCSFSS